MQSANNYLLIKMDVIEEKKSAGGIIISSAFHQMEELTKKNICFATVLYDNPNISYVKKGDRIVINPTKGNKASVNYEDFTVITKEQFLAKIDADGKFIVHPDGVMIKIKKSDTDALYSKWITKNDGTKVQLFLQAEPEQHDVARSSIFVSSGEVVQVGINVSGVEEGDTAILDYTVDNFVDNVLYYDDEENKYVVIDGTTTFHTEDFIVYANRKNPKDTLVYRRGDMDTVSPLLGMIRGEKLIARRPYVFLEHKSNVVDKTTQSGIVYSQTEDVIERKVLAVSEQSEKSFGVVQNETVVIFDKDVFNVKVSSNTIQCVMDEDILMGDVRVGA